MIPLLARDRIRKNLSVPAFWAFHTPLHVHGDHWITISSLKCDQNKIIVNNSVYFDIDEEVKGLINNLFDKETKAVTSKEMPKQKGGSDCGVNAIAVTTTLLHGTKIEKYKSSLMRSHLICCFEIIN